VVVVVVVDRAVVDVSAIVEDVDVDCSVVSGDCADDDPPGVHAPTTIATSSHSDHLIRMPLMSGGAALP
jgi:hypothetical protein